MKNQPSSPAKITEPERALLAHIENHAPFYEQEIHYDYIHFNLESLLEVSQKCLFLDEENLSHRMKIHIYNLLEIAKNLLNKDEYDFLNRLATYARLYKEEKDSIKKSL